MPEQGQVADEKQMVERGQLQRQLAGQGDRWNAVCGTVATAKTGVNRGTRARGRTGAIGGTGVTTSLTRTSWHD